MLRLLNKKIIILCCLVFILSVFVNFSLSDTTQVGYSDFSFLYDGVESTSLSIQAIGWLEIWFDFIIYNKEDTSVNYRLWFVDGYTTTDGFGNRACKSDNEISDFGQYVSWDKTALNIWPNNFATRSLTLKFPSSYSWSHFGCITYYPEVAGSWNTYLNTIPRRWWFIDASVNPSTSGFNLIIRPTFRPSSLVNNTWYSISNADFWLFIYQSGSWTWLYNSAKNSLDPKITTNKHGVGLVSLIPPASGTLYLLAFKGSGTLSLWCTGIRNSDIRSFNFFSWELADRMDSEFMFKYYDWSITGNYLKVWDITSDTTWNYDLIKDPDFTIMTNKLTLSSNITHPHWFDLDLNGVINALEQTMLLDSYNRVWFITMQNDLNITDFINF